MEDRKYEGGNVKRIREEIRLYTVIWRGGGGAVKVH
jgi:hypothetical protein